jgi:ribosome-binding factor A
MRREVGSHLRMKFTPALQFYLDDTLDHVDRINMLIKKIHDGTEP